MKHHLGGNAPTMIAAALAGAVIGYLLIPRRFGNASCYIITAVCGGIGGMHAGRMKLDLAAAGILGVLVGLFLVLGFGWLLRRFREPKNTSSLVLEEGKPDQVIDEPPQARAM